MSGPLTVAVTGLNATDNPGPGVSVIRSLRHDPERRVRVVGLAYDALEPGIYARDLVDDVFMIPYPSQGADALGARLREIHARVPLDVIIPTLDSELDSFIALEPELRQLGIGTLLPTREQLEFRSKARLRTLGEQAGIRVPPGKVLGDVRELYQIHDEIPFPFYLKGPYYGAALVHGVDEAVAAYHRIEATWGGPVVVQARIVGEEFDVAAVGDGQGNLVGALPMKKIFLTDKGKGWAGIAVMAPAALEMTRRFISHTRWRGPCEVEMIQDKKGDVHLLEINPRFPAWIYLSAGAGLNLPWAAVRLAAGEPPPPPTDFRVGTMFVRISTEQIADLADFQRMTTDGEITDVPRRTP